MSVANLLLFVFFCIFTTVGMVLVKLGGQSGHSVLLTVPMIQLKLSLMAIVGFLSYGFSFLLYSALLQRVELSYLNPATVGITSVLIFLCAALIFGEAITLAKVGALVLILAGVLILNLMK